jgi:nicotinamidase/pyrazinamidase
MSVEVTARDALLVVDVQNDFCSGGALGVPRGEDVVPVINRLAPLFPQVVLTQDWHPPGHLSFASSHPGRMPFETIEVSYGTQTLWPDHCVQETHGAAFHRNLRIPHAQLILRKGFRREIDSYSAFQEDDLVTKTGLAGYLAERGVERIFVAGLAYDYCVRFSAVDAISLGIAALVIEDACRAVDVDGSLRAATEEFLSCGVLTIRSGEIRAKT